MSLSLWVPCSYSFVLNLIKKIIWWGKRIYIALLTNLLALCLGRFWKSSLVIMVKRSSKAVAEKEALGAHVERYSALTSLSHFYCLYELYNNNNNNISERIFVTLKLFVYCFCCFVYCCWLFVLLKTFVYLPPTMDLEAYTLTDTRLPLQQFFPLLQSSNPTL